MRGRKLVVAGVLTVLLPWGARAEELPKSAPQTASQGAAQTIALADSQSVSQGASQSASPAAPEGTPAVPQLIPVQQTEPDFPRGRISGYMFGDLYYNASGDPVHTYSGSTDLGKVNVDGNGPITQDLNGIQVRRAYFQVDNDLSIKYSTRFRLEVDSKELTSGGKLGVFVKAAYIQIKYLVPRGNFLFGEISTPTFENSEEFWQYRSIEKTIADFRGISPSADLGVELKGYADAAHRIGYSAMIGDGNGQKPENNRYKRFYLSVPLNLVRDLKLEPYVDYEHGVAGADKALYKLFAGYELKRGAIGAEVVDQVIHSAGPSTEPFGLSIFGRMAATPAVAAYARYDRWQPNTRAANRVDSDLYIAGLDWQPYKDVHVMPNVEAIQYRARGTAVAPAHHDVQGRLTFYYRFSKP